jgi:hypothetical protein
MATPLLRWGLVFLACPIDLPEADRQALAVLAAQAFFGGVSPLHFDWPELRGELRVCGEVVTLGAFVGRPFEAEVHQRSGPSGLVRFLVTEQQLQQSWGQVGEA